MPIYPTQNYRPASVSPANPAAGNECVYTIPDQVTIEIESVRVVLTTSAAVANRTLNIEIRSAGGASYFWTGNAILQTAGVGVTYYFAQGLNQSAGYSVGAFATSPLPYPCTATAGDIFRTATVNLQAGDQISNVIIHYRQRYKN